MTAQVHQIDMETAPVVPVYKRKTNWIIAAAVALAVSGVFFYQQSSHLKTVVSPFEPTPARQQVPINKELDNPLALPVAAAASITAIPASDISSGNAANASSVATTASPPSTEISLLNSAVAATPAAPVVQRSATSASSASGNDADLTTILNRISKMEEALAGLTLAVGKLSTDFTSWVSANPPSPENKVSTAKPESNDTVIARNRIRRPLVKLPARAPVEQANAHPIEASPEVLSVDTWNGKPSVVVRNGSNVQFLSEGDQTGRYTLQRADNDGQRAVFADPTGAVTVQRSLR